MDIRTQNPFKDAYDWFNESDHLWIQGSFAWTSNLNEDCEIEGACMLGALYYATGAGVDILFADDDPMLIDDCEANFMNAIGNEKEVFRSIAKEVVPPNLWIPDFPIKSLISFNDHEKTNRRQVLEALEEMAYLYEGWVMSQFDDNFHDYAYLGIPGE